MDEEWVMTKRLCIFLTVSLLFALGAASQQQDYRKIWNRAYTEGWNFNREANAFLVEVTEGRAPGKALDIGMGQGRNSLYLAEKGWEVTGFDIADEGVRMAQEEARRRNLKLNAVVAGVDDFEYGVERWDLVVGMYMHDLLTRNAEKIVNSVKPGGILVIEGFHRDVKRKSVDTGKDLGFQTNELLQVFGQLRVLRYEDRIATADWLRQELPILRLLARKEPIETE